MNIIKDIIQETQDFRYVPTTIVPGLLFDQWKTINTIHFYWNSKFQTGDTDDEGDKKYFQNESKKPCRTFTKAIDFDTKDIKLLTTGGGDPLKTWFMERDLKYWMRDKQFGKVLNRIFRELPIFGSSVIKMVDGTPYFVDLRNFIVDKSADCLDESNRIIEVHNMTVPDFRKRAKIMKWDQSKVDEVIEKFHEMDGSHITIYERYGEVEVMKGKTKSYPWQRTFIADVGEDKYMQTQTGSMLVSSRGVELSSEDWEGHPYWEFHADKIPGRWLGVGVVEALFEPQIRINELCNLQSKTSYWAALRLFFSRDSAINRNLMTDARNGEVLTGDSEITQIDMSDRNLAFFNEENGKWKQNIDDLTMSYAPVGKSQAAAQNAMAEMVSYFEQVKEDVALAVKEMIYSDIIPQFEKDMTQEHALRLVGQDLDAYAQMVKNQLTFLEVVRQMVMGKFVTQNDADVIQVAIEAAVKQGKEKILTVPKNYYKDVKYDIEIDITGESVDTKGRSSAKLAILQAITADPTMTTDPVKKKILASYMEDVGINPNDLFVTESKTPEQITGMQPTIGRAGGGVSAPVPGMGMAEMQQTTTL